jgi:Cu/Ag efflux protein CusF
MNRKNEITRERKRRKMAGAAIALLLLTGLALASVRMNDAPIRPLQKEKRYELRGVVKSVDTPNRRATIKHEKVGDYMDAMTMPFLIEDEKALNTMRPGDQIKATLVVTGDGGLWLENVAITSKGNSSLEEKNAQAEAAIPLLGLDPVALIEGMEVSGKEEFSSRSKNLLMEHIDHRPPASLVNNLMEPAVLLADEDSGEAWLEGFRPRRKLKR